MLAFIGVLAGLIFIFGDLPYVVDTLRGKTKPHRVSWLLFVILDVISLANQHALHATNSLWLVSAWTLIASLVFILSIHKGVGGFAKLDILCLAGAFLGLLLWAILKTPTASLYCNLAVTVVAFIPTIKKAYYDPATETKISWLMAALSGTLAAVSVGRLDYKLLALPIVSSVATLAVFGTLIHRSSRTAQPKI